MSQPNVSFAETSRWLVMRNLLGLGPRGADIGAIREHQMAPLRLRGMVRMVVSTVTGLIAAVTMLPTTPHLLIWGWLTIHLAMTIWSRRRLVKLRAFGPDHSRQDEFRMLNAHALLISLLWSAAFWLPGPTPDLDHVLPIWSLVLLSMVLLVGFAYTLPSACALFTIPVSISAASAFVVAGQPLLAVTTFAVAVTLVSFSIHLGLVQIRFSGAAVDLKEKSQTVSLLLREFEETSADWLWQTNEFRRLNEVSPRMARALGRSAADAEGMLLLELLAGPKWAHGDLHPSLRTLADKLSRREGFADLLVAVMVGDQPAWWQLSASPRLDDQGRFAGFRGVGSDVTEKHASAAQIQQMARQDSLTGLPNRLALNEALAAALRAVRTEGRQSAMVMIDLDRFKTVNDTLGHPIGDQLLAQVAARLNALVKAPALCARLGGDEFAIVMPHLADPDTVAQLCDAIVQEISRQFLVEDHQLFVGASIGYAIAPQDGNDAELLTRNADLALYKSKAAGGNSHSRYDPSLHAHAEERRVVEQELRGALERGEFFLNFQPVVETETGCLDGFECLLRWTNRTLGNVSPAMFIPVAEDARLIGAIGEWVLREACKEAARWPHDLKVAVNVSADQLTDPGFAGVVVSALANSGLPPRRLEIEVTESVFLQDGGAAGRLLDKLVALGIRLSLDDFGTGYSSLGYLRKTQFSTIKVDRSFVIGASKGVPESIAIIRAVVALADSLGMATTAEGVETEAELATIQALGCAKIQGYYYGRPMPATDVMALFAAQAVPNRAA